MPRYRAPPRWLYNEVADESFVRLCGVDSPLPVADLLRGVHQRSDVRLDVRRRNESSQPTDR